MGAHASRRETDATAAMVALRRIVRFLRLADREVEAATGLSAAQMFVLNALDAQPAASLAELARRTLTDPSSVSGVVEKLVVRKLVRRVRASDDARRTELALTPAGQRMVLRAPRAPQVVMVRELQALPPRRLRGISQALDELVALMGATELAPRMMFEDDQRRIPRSSRRVA